MKRIVWHWTAGAHKPNAVDREAYHFLIDGDGNVHPGDHEPEDNLDCTDDDYAAHTGGANTGAIGISLCAMAGADDSPFILGRYPPTPAQVAALVGLTARLCVQWSIPINRRTTLSHAEVEPTLGIRQNGKWDYRWLPGMELRLHDPVMIGDELRARVLAALPPPPDTSLTFTPRPQSESWWGKVLRWFGQGRD